MSLLVYAFPRDSEASAVQLSIDWQRALWGIRTTWRSVQITAYEAYLVPRKFLWKFS